MNKQFLLIATFYIFHSLKSVINRMSEKGNENTQSDVEKVVIKPIQIKPKGYVVLGKHTFYYDKTHVLEQ